MANCFLSSLGLGIATLIAVVVGNTMNAQASHYGNSYNQTQEVAIKSKFSTNQKFELNYPPNTNPAITYPKASIGDWEEVKVPSNTIAKKQPSKPLSNITPSRPIAIKPIKTSLVPMDFDEIDALAQELYEDADYEGFQTFLDYRQQHDLLIDSLEDENANVEVVNLKIDQLTDKYPTQVANYQKYFDTAGKKLNMMR
jgi:hypothetical protein